MAQFVIPPNYVYEPESDILPDPPIIDSQLGSIEFFPWTLEIGHGYVRVDEIMYKTQKKLIENAKPWNYGRLGRIPLFTSTLQFEEKLKKVLAGTVKELVFPGHLQKEIISFIIWGGKNFLLDVSAINYCDGTSSIVIYNKAASSKTLSNALKELGRFYPPSFDRNHARVKIFTTEPEGWDDDDKGWSSLVLRRKINFRSPFVFNVN